MRRGLVPEIIIILSVVKEKHEICDITRNLLDYDGLAHLILAISRSACSDNSYAEDS